MSTGIEWTSETWNPTIGCSIVSPGCKNCYAMKIAHRLASNPKLPTAVRRGYRGTTKATKNGPVWTNLIRSARQQTVLKPRTWKMPRLVFVNSMSDAFHEGLDDQAITRIWAVMATSRQHTYQVLTKRPDHMLAFLQDPKTPVAIERAARTIDPAFRLAEWPLKNVWCGTSVEDQTRARDRIQTLLKVPAAVRFLSMEPLLGEVRLSKEMRGADWRKLHWVIVGGESGARARPMHPQWARTIRDECRKHKVPFFFKQVGSWSWGLPERRTQRSAGLTWDGRVVDLGTKGSQPIAYGSKKAGGRELDGYMHEEMPVGFTGTPKRKAPSKPPMKPRKRRK